MACVLYRIVLLIIVVYSIVTTLILRIKVNTDVLQTISYHYELNSNPMSDFTTGYMVGNNWADLSFAGLFDSHGNHTLVWTGSPTIVYHNTMNIGGISDYINGLIVGNGWDDLIYSGIYSSQGYDVKFYIGSLN